jgi:RimJ/RimL family protein N-acetyltransferase
MTLSALLLHAIDEYNYRKAGGKISNIIIAAPSVWEIDISFTLHGTDHYIIRNIRDGDLELLYSFGDGLGELSKDLFGPYPWYDADRLKISFINAIQQSVDRKTASYLLIRNGTAIGHFFLWAAGGNAHSARHGVEIPELGVAIADAFHGKGFGGLTVSILQAAAHSLNADGVELTTAMTNESGWNTYQRAGFEYTGILRIPLEVDVTAATEGLVNASKYRDERQMLYTINMDKREEMLAYLKLKRVESGTE